MSNMNNKSVLKAVSKAQGKREEQEREEEGEERRVGERIDGGEHLHPLPQKPSTFPSSFFPLDLLSLLSPLRLRVITSS